MDTTAAVPVSHSLWMNRLILIAMATGAGDSFKELNPGSH